MFKWEWLRQLRRFNKRCCWWKIDHRQQKFVCYMFALFYFYSIFWCSLSSLFSCAWNAVWLLLHIFVCFVSICHAHIAAIKPSYFLDPYTIYFYITSTRHGFLYQIVMILYISMGDSKMKIKWIVLKQVILLNGFIRILIFLLKFIVHTYSFSVISIVK